LARRQLQNPRAASRVQRSRQARGRGRRMTKLAVLAVFVAALSIATAASAQVPQPPPPTSPYGSMQAGGLSPPPPMNPGAPPPSTPTVHELENAKKKDAGRGLTWVWLNVEGGFEHVDLKTFSVNEDKLTAGFINSSSPGGMIGAGLGARIVFLTLGIRG